MTNICLIKPKRLFTKEHIENLRKSHLGQKGYWLNKKRDEKTKLKISTKVKKLWNDNKYDRDRFQNEEYRKKISERQRGKKLSEITKKRISIGVQEAFKREEVKNKHNLYIKNRDFYKENNPFFGKYHTQEIRDKISESGKGRVVSKETREKHSLSNRGFKHWNWKNGITSLAMCIRHLDEYKQWRKQVFEKDNYTCQECGERGCYLETHHIKLFSVILKEFLNQYSQFSPIEDKETLVRLAINYTPFWEVNNGKTLCKECHTITKIGRKTYDKI